MFVKLFRIFRQNVAKFTHFRKKFIKLCSEFDEVLSEFHIDQIFSKMLKNPELNVFEFPSKMH